jgi:hypothetical protein
VRSRRSTGSTLDNPRDFSREVAALTCSGRSHTKCQRNPVDATSAINPLRRTAQEFTVFGTSSRDVKTRVSISLKLDSAATAEDRRDAHFSSIEDDHEEANRLISDHSAGVEVTKMRRVWASAFR